MNKSNFLLFIRENKNKLLAAGILAFIATLIVCYIISNSFLLTNSFALEETHNNTITYFVKYSVIYIGIFFFSLGLVYHNKYTLILFCYSYLTLLFFLFFIKGIIIEDIPRNIPNINDLAINFSMLFTGALDDNLNVIMPILVYPILDYLMKNKKKAFLVGLALIILIEPIQLLTNFGAFDVNDFYQNLIGYLFGVLIYFIIYYIYKNKKDKST